MIALEELLASTGIEDLKNIVTSAIDEPPAELMLPPEAAEAARTLLTGDYTAIVVTWNKGAPQHLKIEMVNERLSASVVTHKAELIYTPLVVEDEGEET